MESNRKTWDDLPMREKAAMIGVAVRNGIVDLQEIRQRYNEFAMGGDTEEKLKPASVSEARRMGALVGVAPFTRPKSYIGGDRKQTWDKYWQTDNEMYMLTDSVAREYGINPDLLRYRLNNEGYTDARVKEINKDYADKTNKTVLGEALFKSDAMPYIAGDEFGLDDTATYIKEGKVNLINENWGDGQFLNEKGRWTSMAMGHKYSDNMGIMAATIRYFRDLAKKDFPNASSVDLDRYAAAYYNRGPKGGKEWVKRGAKGYKLKEFGGPLVEAAMNEYRKGGKIHIKPSKRGTFTAAAKKHGKSVQAFASQVLSHPENYSPAMRKKANFARNAAKWYGLGGNLFDGTSQPSQKMKIGKPYYSYDENGRKIDDTLNYNINFPEIVITPDSRKFPAERNENERYRQRTQRDYAEQKNRNYTERQVAKSQKEWDNSLEKALLDYGQAAATGIGIGTDIVSGLPVYSSLKGVRVLNEAKTPIDYVESGLWLTPIGGVAGREAWSVGRSILKRPTTSEYNMGLPSLLKSNTGLEGATEIPLDRKGQAAWRMIDFINSPEYQERLGRAGLEKHSNFMKGLIEERVNNNGFFPAREVDIIKGNPETTGLSDINPVSDWYGVSIKRGLSEEEFANNIDHELAHWSTGNAGTSDIINFLQSYWRKMPQTRTTKIGDIMRYNDTIAPIKSWEEFEASLPKDTPKELMDKFKENLKYLQDPQERRSQAYAMLQEVKRRNMSIDDFIDAYTRNGEIVNNAPENLRFLGASYTPENIKKFIKNFLSVASPISVGISLANDD